MRDFVFRRVLKRSALLLALGLPFAAGAADPFSTRELTSSSPLGQRVQPRGCAPLDGAPLNLAAVIETALCNNPQTAQAWAQARAQAASVGVARGAYLPTLSASAGSRRSNASGQYESDASAAATLSYVLFDSGVRASQLDIAQQSLLAALGSQESVVQSVFFSAGEAYFQWFGRHSALDASRESEAAALESLKAARARKTAGTGTPADELQAQTAYSQAVLNRIRAEGDANTARGVLANVMGLEAQTPLVLAPPTLSAPTEQLEREVGRLIELAKRTRPDLAAAQARANAARSSIDAERAAGRPSVAVSASRNLVDPAGGGVNYANQLGVNVTIPIFSGFVRSYRVAAAQADLDAKNAARDAIAQQLTLDVWRAHNALMTDTQSLTATADLLRSAEQSYKVALGRYQAGVGSILDVLNAQSAAASARSQMISARYNWQISRLALGQAVGQLDFGMLDAGAKN